jgi:beta-galactosidase/beta-glucuronidase
LWRAETATTEAAAFKMADGRTTVPLRLEPWGTVFVVFHKPTSETSHVVPEVTETKVTTLSGLWSVSFQPDRGAPASITMDHLSDWSQSADSGVKYFSGVGTYTKTVQASPDWFRKGARLWLDLGDVKNLAVVSVNGKEVGETWHAPYRVDVTSALKRGANEITIKVVNAWVNRLIGDEQPGAKKLTFADVKPYKADSPLVPSGLLGPVTVVRRERP